MFDRFEITSMHQFVSDFDCRAHRFRPLKGASISYFLAGQTFVEKRGVNFLVTLYFTKSFLWVISCKVAMC